MKKYRIYLERSLIGAGLALLVFFAVAMADRYFSSRAALKSFDRNRPTARAEAEVQRVREHKTAAVESALHEGTVDFALWSPKRIREYRESLLVKTFKPLGVVGISRLGIRAPIFEGTDELVLNRGVGWIPGTERVGAPGNGNVGIAGHRDGFFRAMKDVAVGDVVELALPGGIDYYSVDSMEVVYPTDVRVLNPRGVVSVTFVTCYPFYFVGDAPRRFIVHAKRSRRERAS